MARDGLPKLFCWSRFGTEAGQPIEAILHRKEIERRTGYGLFLWGIGNSVAPGIAELVRRCERPEVLFSPIKGRPRPIDASPGQVVRWRTALGLDGRRWELPEGIRVTSRAKQGRSAHHALVCRLGSPIQLADHGRLRFGRLRNLLSDSPLGPSQVTAVVRRVDGDAAPAGSIYTIALRAELVPPYFVRLGTPEPVDVSEARWAA